MALHHGEEHFTKWTHVENGQVLNRRIHRMEVQARDGRLYVIRGKELPDFIQTSCGQGYKGEHIAQILLRPKSNGGAEHLPSVQARFWPTARDALHVVGGVIGVLLARFILMAVASAGM